VPVAGGAAVPKATMTDHDAGFVWSPNDSQVATTEVGVTVYAFATSKLTWAPDGQRIAFLKSSGGVFVVGAAGGAVTPIPGTSTADDVQWQP